MATWLRVIDGGVVIRLWVQPGAKVSELVGPHGDRMKLKVAAPPIDGRANEEVVEFLSRCLQIPKSRIEIVAGESARGKDVFCQGISENAVLDLLGAGR